MILVSQRTALVGILSLCTGVIIYALMHLLKDKIHD
jgi:hypothetical protein